MEKSHWLFFLLFFFNFFFFPSFSVMKNCPRETETVYSGYRQDFPQGRSDLDTVA